MNIQSAYYNLDANANKVSIHIVHDGGECDVPLSGVGWINQALNDWVADDGIIAASHP